MAGPVLEIVPNFSEGVDDDVIAAIGDELASGGAHVADVHIDADHHRCVYTVFGDEQQLHTGAVAAVRCAGQHIDLAAHDGEHPRIGACDVMPVVAMHEHHPRGGTRDDAIALARRLAADLPEQAGVQVIEYGVGIAGAPRFAGEARKLVGSSGHAHSTTIVGCREVLIAFNVALQTDDIAIARTIAGQIRESNGGLPGIRALGFSLESNDIVQVSTNVERWRECGPADVLRDVAAAAANLGVAVDHAELVGLAPREALTSLAGAVNDLNVPLDAAADSSIETHALRCGM